MVLSEAPAPQAGLMALMAQGIVGGEMAWPLVIVGMFFGVVLILISAPAPMLIAVGMYLPFGTTAAVFAGGIIRAILEWFMKRRNASDEEKARGENSGVLVASGLIAGQSLMAVLLAFVVLYEQAKLGMAGKEHLLPQISHNFWAGLLVYPLLLAKPVEARYVRFSITPARILTVSEVQVLDFIRYKPFDLRNCLSPPWCQ